MRTTSDPTHRRHGRGWIIPLAVTLAAFATLGPTAAARADEPEPSSTMMQSPRARDAATRRMLRAATTGRTRGVQEALDAGARVDEHGDAFVGPSGQTALVAAALRGHADVVRLLVEAGADPAIPEKDGFTVWHAAAFQGRTSVLEVLDELDVPGVGPSPADGYWPLHRAAWGSTSHHVEAVRYLIGPAGQACDVTGRDGRTPLDLARHAPIRALLEACAPRAGDDAEAVTPGS